MRLPDLNLLIYATDRSSPRFARAKDWLEEVLSGSETVAFAWPVLIGFLRLTTRAQVVASPLRPDEAMDIINGWLRRPNAIVVNPTDRHLAIVQDLLAPLGAGGNLTTDAHLAALAIEHGATLCSSDGDFRRFAGLRWEDPLS